MAGWRRGKVNWGHFLISNLITWSFTQSPPNLENVLVFRFLHLQLLPPHLTLKTFQTSDSITSTLTPPPPPNLKLLMENFDITKTSLETGRLPSRLGLQSKILPQICLQLLSHFGPVNITLSWKHNGSHSMQIKPTTVSIYYQETKYENSSKWCIVCRFSMRGYTSLYSGINTSQQVKCFEWNVSHILPNALHREKL